MDDEVKSFYNGWNVLEQYKFKELHELKAISKSDRLPYSVLLLNTSYDLNMGNCCRSAHLLGAEKVYVLGNVRFDKRSCVGAQNYQDIIKIRIEDKSKIGAEITRLSREYHFTPFMIEKTDCSKSTDSSDFRTAIVQNLHPCLIFGNENEGIPDDIMVSYPLVFHVEQKGVLRSFNLASACAIVCHTVCQILPDAIANQDMF